MRLNTGCLRGESTFRPGFTSPRPDDSSGLSRSDPCSRSPAVPTQGVGGFRCCHFHTARHGAHPLCSEEPRSTQTSGFHPETLCWGLKASMTLAFLSAKQAW